MPLSGKIENQKKKVIGRASHDIKGTTKKKGGGTVLDKIVASIRQVTKNGSANLERGVSRTAILKHLKAEFNYENDNAVKVALKNGVSKRILVQTGQSFRVASDPKIEKELDPNDTLKIEDVLECKSNKKSSSGNEKFEMDTAQAHSSVLKADHGDEVTVSYVGTLEENGYEFDRANNFTFLLGAGEVIKGWDQGVKGMLVGGKRKLTVPPRLGYGKRGCKPDIPGNATLSFTITMKKIRKQVRDMP